VITQLVEDRVHLERGVDRLDQDGALDRAVRQSELLLGERERACPEPSLEMRLELGKIEVGAGPPFELLARVVEDDEPEVEERRADRRAVDEVVALDQVPAARTDDERRRLVVQAVALLTRVECDRAPHRIAHVALPVLNVGPRRRVGVLEVGHEHLRA
jgi:hypothetical protein